MKKVKALLTLLLLVGGQVSAQDTPAIHTIGEKFGGGTVFYVTPSGLHGLVVESTDIPCKTNLDSSGEDKEKDHVDPRLVIGNFALLSPDGREYADWKIPSFQELGLLYLASKSIVGLKEVYYVTDFYVQSIQFRVWAMAYYTGLNFKDGSTWTKDKRYFIRLIRSF